MSRVFIGESKGKCHTLLFLVQHAFRGTLINEMNARNHIRPYIWECYTSRPEDWFSYLGQENPTRTPVLGYLIRNGLSRTVDCWHCLMTLLFMTSQRVPLHYSRCHHRFQLRWMLILWTNSFKTSNYFRYKKSNQLLVSDPEWQISVSGDTMSHPSLCYPSTGICDITLDWDLSPWNRY